MPSLIRKNDGHWEVENSTTNPVWKSIQEWQPGQALRLEVDAELDPEFVNASAIAIEFPAFFDGRGLSLAVLLRTRLHFTGELRAMGSVHEDILHYMIRCGFDTLELSGDRDINTAFSALAPYSDQYQASVSQPQPVFRRVHRGVSA